MSDIPDIYLAREFIAYLWHNTEPPASKALLAVAQTLSEKLSMPPLCYAGNPPPRLIELNEAFINVYLKQFEQFWEMNILQPFHLTNHQFQLSFLGQINMSIGLIDKLSFRLLEIPHPEIFPELVAQICQEFGAFQAFMWDPKLAGFHGRLRRIEESILDEREPEEENLTDLSPPIEDSRDTLPPLMLRDEFDYRRVPDGVWWINFWDKIQVETIGLQRILSANWARIIEQPKGALLLVATDEPTDVNNPDHILQLGEIVSHLRLRELQDCHPISQQEPD